MTHLEYLLGSITFIRPAVDTGKCQAALSAPGQRINRQPTAGNPRCLKLNKNQLAARRLTGRRFIPACWTTSNPSFLGNIRCDMGLPGDAQWHCAQGWVHATWPGNASDDPLIAVPVKR